MVCSAFVIITTTIICVLTQELLAAGVETIWQLYKQCLPINQACWQYTVLINSTVTQNMFHNCTRSVKNVEEKEEKEEKRKEGKRKKKRKNRKLKKHYNISYHMGWSSLTFLSFLFLHSLYSSNNKSQQIHTKSTFYCENKTRYLWWLFSCPSNIAWTRKKIDFITDIVINDT